MSIPESKLYLPGPTPVPMALWQAMLEPMTNHRGPEGDALFRSLTAGLQSVWGTSGPTAVLPLSGTGGLEALLDNAVAPGEAVLAVTMGAFGDRWGEVAVRRGFQVDWLRVPWGEAADPDGVAEALGRKPYQAVLLTHNETSTGVLNPVQDIVRAIRPLVPLVLLDSISGSPSVPLELDAWEVDAVVTGSQKGFMLPPGLAMIGVREAARARFAGRPSVYYDLAPHFAGDWPYTVPLSLMRGLRHSLALLAEESAPRRFKRHEVMGAMVRAGARALGFTVMASEPAASPTVTALEPPGGLAPGALRAAAEEFGAVLAGGQGAWQARVVRVGHVGATGPLDVLGALGAMEMACARLGVGGEPGRGTAAAMTVWRDTAPRIADRAAT